MNFKKNIKKVKKFLIHKKIMIVITAIVLFIRVKISEVPILKIFSTVPLAIAILQNL